MGTCLSIYEQIKATNIIWPIGIAPEPLAMRVKDVAPRERWNYELLGATVTGKIRAMLVSSMEPGVERSIS